MAARSASRKARRTNEAAAEEPAVVRPNAPAVPAIAVRDRGDKQPAADDRSEQLLTFFASSYEYAVSILHVREIAEYRELTPVPGTPSWLRGVMNLRGTVVPAIDLAAKLGMPQTPVTRKTCLLIVEVTVAGEETIVAIMVDSVSRVVELSTADLQDVPSFGPRVDTTFIVGMARLDGRLVLLLDIDRIVQTDDIAAAATMMSAIAEHPDPSHAETA